VEKQNKFKVDKLQDRKSISFYKPWKNLSNLESISELIHLEGYDVKTPLMALDVVILCGEIGITSPQWAIEILRQVKKDRLTTKIQNLDIAFGFKASRGKTPEIRKNLLENRNDKLLTDVWRLTQLGITRDDACLMVAYRFKETGVRLNKTNYDLDFLGDQHTIAETLKKMYRPWLRRIQALRKKHEEFRMIEEDIRAYIESNKEEYLSQFPNYTKI